MKKSLTAALLGLLVLTGSMAAPAAPIDQQVAVATPVAKRSANPFQGRGLFVQKSDAVMRTIGEWKGSRAKDAQALELIAAAPTAIWLGDWTQDVEKQVRQTTEAAAREKKLPVFVLYNIPQRDLHSYSGGGAKSREAYLQWIDSVARGLGKREAVFILEPDAVAHAPEMNEGDREARFALLKEATNRLQNVSGASVYLDAGHPRWLAPEKAADLLRKAGVQNARGFALNVSNFVGTRENIEYGNKVGRLIGKSYVIDTSRNGLGPSPDGQVINPDGRSLGELPSVISTEPLLDANLWVKRPGESDGSRAGAPAAGSWWPEFALGLVQRAPQQVALRQAVSN